MRERRALYRATSPPLLCLRTRACANWLFCRMGDRRVAGGKQEPRREVGSLLKGRVLCARVEHAEAPGRDGTRAWSQAPRAGPRFALSHLFCPLPSRVTSRSKLAPKAALIGGRALSSKATERASRPTRGHGPRRDRSAMTVCRPSDRRGSGSDPKPQCAFKVSMFNVSCNSH